MENFIHLGLMLSDNSSKKLLNKLLFYKLGTHFMDEGHYLSLHPFYTKEQWASLDKNSKKYAIPGDSALDRIGTWALENYSYYGNGFECSAELGDAVLDCGAYTGSTTIYFSKRVDYGHVYAFEATPVTAKELETNITNASLTNVTIINMAISDKKEILQFNNAIGISNMPVKENGVKVQATSLDLWIMQNEIKKLDFIKMDIEGSEQAALRGAKNTILRFTPKMAISVYHTPDDLYEIPKIILSINPYYKLYLKHGSRGSAETIMFFLPSPEPLALPIVPNIESVKEMYTEQLRISVTKTNKYLLERIISHMSEDLETDTIPIKYFYDEGFAQLNFSKFADTCYKVSVRKQFIIELHFENVSRCFTDREIAEITKCYAELQYKFPEFEIYNKKDNLNIYCKIRHTKCPEQLKNDVHVFLDQTKLVAHHFNILIRETLPFLMNNGFVSEKYFSFWSELKL